MTSSAIASPADGKKLTSPVEKEIEISLLTGGFDKPYAFGLATALAKKRIALDVIGNSYVDSPEMHTTPKLNFLSLYWEPLKEMGAAGKLSEVLGFYAKILKYAASGTPKIFHLLWNNKFPFFDRTILMLYYKALGKKVVFTAHNVNAGKRDGNDSAMNRLGLKIQYTLADHIFVHTEKMKQELFSDFAVPARRVTVIPFGINNSVPDTDLTPAEARRRLGLEDGERTILFFGGRETIQRAGVFSRRLQSARTRELQTAHRGRSEEGHREVHGRYSAGHPQGWHRGKHRSKAGIRSGTKTQSCISKRRMFACCPTRWYFRAAFCSCPTVLEYR